MRLLLIVLFKFLHSLKLEKRVFHSYFEKKKQITSTQLYNIIEEGIKPHNTSVGIRILDVTPHKSSNRSAKSGVAQIVLINIKEMANL